MKEERIAEAKRIRKLRKKELMEDVSAKENEEIIIVE